MASSYTCTVVPRWQLSYTHLEFLQFRRTQPKERENTPDHYSRRSEGYSQFGGCVCNRMEQESLCDTGCILGVSIIYHQSPAIFLRCLESSNRCIITDGGQHRFHWNNISVIAVFCINRQAVQCLIYLQEIIGLLANQAVYVLNQTTAGVKVELVTIDILPAGLCVAISNNNVQVNRKPAVIYASVLIEHNRCIFCYAQSAGSS